MDFGFEVSLPDDLPLREEFARMLSVVRSYASYLRAIGYDPDDPYQGLVVSEEDLERALSDLPPWEPDLPSWIRPKGRFGCELKRADSSPPICRLVQSLGLSPFELDALLLALLSEISPRYEKVIAYLNNDVTKPFPTVFLASRLFSGIDGVDDPMLSFRKYSPLLRHGLIRWVGDTDAVPLVSRQYRLDESVVDFLMSKDVGTDLIQEPVYLPEAVVRQIRNIAHKVASGDIRMVAFDGGSVSTLEAAAAYLGAVIGRPIIASVGGDFRRVARDALLMDKLPVWHCSDLKSEDIDGLHRAATDYEIPMALLCTERGFPLPGDAVRVSIPLPDLQTREKLWREALSGVPAEGVDAEDLARRYRIGEESINSAAEAALRIAWLDGREVVAAQDVESAIRQVSSPALGSLARKLEPRYTWDDIVLPDDVKEQLRELGAAIRHREVVYEEWGFEKRAEGRGINALFAGPSGTGKTMAAEILARESGMDIFKIDLSSVVSKYVGETEKHLQRIFKEASRGNVILFFDEADALFGKRSEVRDAHDRYANIEVAYLLQALEEHTGVVIMATNLFGNLDSAFVRRMHFVVHFPFPDEEMRRRIWRVVFPKEAPLGADVDFSQLGKQLQVTGGHIRNIAMAAAFLAAADGRIITREHISHAARRELQKMGKLVGEGGV